MNINYLLQRGSSKLPETVVLTDAANVLQTYTLQFVNAGITASKPAKLDADKKFVTGDINLASEVTGVLPIANGGTGSSTKNFVDLTTAQSVSGVKTFEDFPLTPGTAPSTNYQVANKKYVDDEIDLHIVGALIYKGLFDASAGNYDAITNPKAGWFYKIGVSGVIGMYDFQVGDNLYINKDVVGNPVAADVDHIDNVDLVSSVNGKVGAVVLTTADIAEVTNLYWTSGRFDTAFSGKTTDNLTQGLTNKYYSSTLFNNDFAGKTTLDLTEGVSGNFYFTAARAKAAAVVNSTAGSETDQAPSVSAVKALVAGIEGASFDVIVGESFGASETFAIRKAVSGETAGRFYKATSDEQNASGKYIVVGFIQTTGVLSAGDTIKAYKFLKDLPFKANDTVLGASSDDQGKMLWLNKDGKFSLNPAAGITVGEKYACVTVGVLNNYNATVTSESMMVDAGIGNISGFDIA